MGSLWFSIGGGAMAIRAFAAKSRSARLDRIYAASALGVPLSGLSGSGRLVPGFHCRTSRTVAHESLFWLAADFVEHPIDGPVHHVGNRLFRRRTHQFGPIFLD